MKGVLADVNIEGHVDYLMRLVQSGSWNSLWEDLGLAYLSFDDVGLDHEASDAVVWQCCQDEGYVLITDNRNHDAADSLEATIRARNAADSLPVLTIGNTQRLRHSREYAESVVVSLLRTLIGIEALRGAGRLYLP